MKIGKYLLATLAGLAFVTQPLPAQSVGPPATDGGPRPGVVQPWPPLPDDDQRAGGAPPATDGPGPGPGGADGSGPDGPAHRPDGGDTADGLCKPGTPPAAPATTSFYDGNRLLGPQDLPYAKPVGPLLAGYQRFGRLSQQDWVNTFTNTAHDAYVYPPLDGFVLGPDGRPIKAAQELQPGYRLDRFGFPGGAFLAPLGLSFASRSLPPANLNTPAATPPATVPLANYHVYCVLRPFTVDAGPIAPWFAQPGLGTQFKLSRQYLPQAGAALSVTWLLDHGYLVEENIDGDGAGCVTVASDRRC